MLKTYLIRKCTAEFVCAVRGALWCDKKHPLYEHFHDQYAARLCGYPWRVFFWIPLLSPWIFAKIFRGLMEVGSLVLLRSWNTEKEISSFVDKKVGSQVVMVGSGLDSFQLRNPALMDKINLYEVDCLEMIYKKSSRIKKIQPEIHKSCHFVVATLSKELPISLALKSSTIDYQKPTFFSMLGLSYYLTEKDFFACMEDLSVNFSKGSMVSMDYLVEDQFLSKEQIHYKKIIMEIVADMGEKMVFEISKNKLQEKMSKLNFKLKSDVFLDSLYDQYGLSDHPTAKPNAFSLAIFEKTK